MRSAINTSTKVTLADHSKVDLKKPVANIAPKAGLKKCPHVVLEGGVDAHTRFKKICIGLELPPHLTKVEMKGVIAHEVHHVAEKSFDFETLSWIAYPVVACVFLYMLHAALETSEIILIVILFVPYFLIIRRYMSKRAEFEADEFAKSIVGVKPFSTALKKIHKLRGKRNLRSKLLEILSPHPALKDRLSKLAESSS